MYYVIYYSVLILLRTRTVLVIQLYVRGIYWQPHVKPEIRIFTYIDTYANITHVSLFLAGRYGVRVLLKQQ